MPTTQPSNGVADLRPPESDLSPDAAACLRTIRTATEPLTTGNVYSATDDIPVNGRYRVIRALNELFDARLIVLVDYNSYGHARYAPASPPLPPARPTFRAYHQAVEYALDTLAKGARMSFADLWAECSVFADRQLPDALIDLIADGRVIRTLDSEETYVYALVESPVPSVTSAMLDWLRTLEANDDSLVVVDFSPGSDERVDSDKSGLATAKWVATSRTRYTLTDLGRRVLAANAEPERAA